MREHIHQYSVRISEEVAKVLAEYGKRLRLSLPKISNCLLEILGRILMENREYNLDELKEDIAFINCLKHSKFIIVDKGFIEKGFLSNPRSLPKLSSYLLNVIEWLSKKEITKIPTIEFVEILTKSLKYMGYVSAVSFKRTEDSIVAILMHNSGIKYSEWLSSEINELVEQLEVDHDLDVTVREDYIMIEGQK